MSNKEILREAIEKKQAISFQLHGEPEIGSPHALGVGDGVERLLIYRGEDSHEKRVPPTGKWTCVRLTDIGNIQILPDEPFHTGHPGDHVGKCLHDIEISVS
jgi:hypothetical protein